MEPRGLPKLPEELCKIIDAVAWAETCLRFAAACRGKPSFAGELKRLQEAVPDARKLVDAYQGRMGDAIMVSLRTSELGLIELLKL